MPPLTSCGYCQSRDLHPVLSLGDQPPSNSFIREDQVAGERSFPLDVVVCRSCWLSQLTFVVPAMEIFDKYVYLSSASDALRRHYRALAAQLVERLGLDADQLVVDVGCNDGILLREYPSRLRRVGVEPSQVAEIARSHGLDVVQAFFDGRVADDIVARYGTAAVVTVANVYSQVDDPDVFTAACATLIGDDGVLIIEASYVGDVIGQLLFDTIYHEHRRYIGLTPLVPFLRKHGLVVVDFERPSLGASGPAFRAYARPSRWNGAIDPSVEQALAQEREWGISRLETYETFADRVRSLRDQLLDLIGTVRASGGGLVGYGAPAKGNTLLNYLGLDRSAISYIAETNRLKHGLLTPGSHIPVVPEETLLRDMPPYALLLVWNYVDHFLQNSEYIKRGGRFIVPLPEPRIAPEKSGA